MAETQAASVSGLQVGDRVNMYVLTAHVPAEPDKPAGWRVTFELGGVRCGATLSDVHLARLAAEGSES